MIWENMVVDDKVCKLRAWFETYMDKKDMEADTYECDKCIMRFYTDAKEKDLWDGDYDSFYNFMVENRV